MKETTQNCGNPNGDVLDVFFLLPNVTIPNTIEHMNMY